MKHHEACKSWPSFHPYDCPECKILGDTRLYTPWEIQKLQDEAFEEGMSEAEYELEDKLNDSYDEGYEAGKEAVLNSPEEFGLVEANG